MLGIFLDTVFVAWKGPNRLWVEYLATADRARRPQDLKLKFRDGYHDGDLSVQLRMLILLCREPNTPFNRESLQQAQEMARDVRAIRKHLAHHLPISDDWAYNAIVRCQTLLKWIEAPDVSRQHSDAKLSKAARKYAKYLQMRWNPMRSQWSAGNPLLQG